MPVNYNRKNLFESFGGVDSGTLSRIDLLENNEYKVAYFTQISSSSGTITIPTNATILLGEFQSGVDAYVSEIQNDRPDGNAPQTASGAQVSVISFDTLGNYTLSGTPAIYPVALIYILKIKAKFWPSLDVTKIIDQELETTKFPDNVFSIFNSGNNGAGVKFDTSLITAGQIRTLSIPDASGTIALTSTIVPDKYYKLIFTSAVSVTILGTTHTFARIPDITIYDPTGQTIFANTTVNTTTFDVIINFNRTQTGTIILT